MIDERKLFYGVNAENAVVDRYGYFTNTIGELKKALEQNKTTLKVVYSKLDGILDENHERRFSSKNGTFGLFYELDYHFNKTRY